MSQFKRFCVAVLSVVTLVTALLLLSGYQASSKKKLTVLLFMSTDCPVAIRYPSRIQALVKDFPNAEFKSYFPNDLETVQGIQKYAKERGYEFPTLIDNAGERAKQLGVKFIPTAVLLDSSGKVVYHGPIDDHKEPSLARAHYLRDALSSASNGETPAVKRADAFGCVLMPAPALPKPTKVTYAEHVKTIIDRSCVRCHQPSAVAPFSLVGYQNARKWAPMIGLVTQKRSMPPWKAVHGYGEFEDENRLLESEIEIIKRWSESGAPSGDLKKAPADPKLKTGEWELGTPDAVLGPSKPFKLAADGPDVYRHFVIKTNFPDTKYVQAMAVKPGNAKVVHHVIAYIDERGASAKLDGKDGQEGYSTFGGPGFVPQGSLGGWAPGNQPLRTPKGIGFELKPGATIVLQVHYHRTGIDETDLTKIGLYFNKEPVEKVMSLSWMANVFLRIPAGEKAYLATYTFPVPADVTVYSLMPHMHLLGKSMKATVTYPDGTKEVLIYVDDWDFNWQMNYTLKVPKKLPKGSKIDIETVYDNSADNPNNPNSPPKVVTWGEETTDEMFLLIASYTIDQGRKPANALLGFGRQSRRP